MKLRLYIKIKGKDYYLYRAIEGADTLEFMLSEKQDEESAFKFLKKAIGQQGLPECITIDKSGANEAVITLLSYMLYLIGLWPYYWVEDRQIKYLFYLLVISYLVVCVINLYFDLDFAHSVEWIAAIISAISLYIISHQKAKKEQVKSKRR
ncbi:transposase [Thiotrichales bacterium 19X7-9]|nr:transposase [Thiotrichales bacterium 19X7-9]